MAWRVVSDSAPACPAVHPSWRSHVCLWLEDELWYLALCLIALIYLFNPQQGPTEIYGLSAGPGLNVPVFGLLAGAPPPFGLQLCWLLGCTYT